MKIEANSPPVRFSPAVPPAPSKKTFGDMLGNAAGAAEVRDRALGFEELGMFGRFEVLSAMREKPVIPGNSAGLGPTSLSRATQDLRDRSPVPAVGPAQLRRSVGASVDAEGARLLHSTYSMRSSTGSQDTPPPALAAPGPEEPVSEPVHSRSWSAVRLTRPPHRPTAAVNLLLSEQDGEVQISCGAAGLEPQARAALRRLSVEILAEFGLGLSEFSLNGTVLPSNLDSMIGVRNGTRPR